MKVTAAFGVAALALLSTACPSSPPPRQATVAQDVEPFVKDARLTRSVTFDNGKLRLDPTHDEPKLDEKKALQQWLYAGTPVEFNSVVIVYARVTMQTPVTVDSWFKVRPHALPSFRNRPAWAIFGYRVGVIECGPITPDNTNHLPTAPRSQSLLLLAGDGSNEGVAYQTAGYAGFCLPSLVKSSAQVASYIYSPGWRVAASRKQHETIAISVPPCSRLLNLYGPIYEHRAWTYDITLKTLMVVAPCVGDRLTQTVDYDRSRAPAGRPGPETVRHQPIGPVSFTSFGNLSTITYFDGATRKFRTS